MSVASARYNTITNRFRKGSSALPLERDAWAFIEAAGLTSRLHQEAIVTLVRDLKRANLWTKMKAIYPFVGGTATTHKWNLKDPRDADAAFRLTFNGGWTHSNTGADPNGTTGYANTYITPVSHLSLNDMHISVQQREDRNSSETYAVPIGSQRSDGTGRSYIVVREGAPPGNTTTVVINTKFVSGSSDFTTFNDNTAIGYYVASRTSATKIVAYKDGVSKGSNLTFTSDSLSPNQIFIGAMSATTNSPFYYSFSQFSFATIGLGLTDTDATNLYNAVDRYQKFLGRAV